MKILFICLGTLYDLGGSSVHIDVIRRLADDHEVWLVCKNEHKQTELTVEYGINVLRVHTLEQKRVGLVKKGIGTILVGPQFKRAVKKHLSNIQFDLILYTTPPVTFTNVIRYAKNNNHNAVTYLMLKDIFPQNAVDIGILSTRGVKGILYKYFRHKEKQLYKLSDFIGCMSQANVEFIKRNNEYLDFKDIEICPNSTIIEDMSIDENERIDVRRRYGLPLDKKIFVYGGNLGKPQGIPFFIECLKKQNEEDAFFLVIGGGTEYGKLQYTIANETRGNCKLMAGLPKTDFEKLVAACDIGMIFLDYRFTIPNFPSRLLSYMKSKVPVLAATDPNTDLGEVITEGGFGWWCESNDSLRFCEQISSICQITRDEYKEMGEKAFRYLQDHYSVDIVCDTITSKVRPRITVPTSSTK